MTEKEDLLEQYTRSRHALVRASERSTSGASKDFLELVVSKIDKRLNALREMGDVELHTDAVDLPERADDRWPPRCLWNVFSRRWTSGRALHRP